MVRKISQKQKQNVKQSVNVKVHIGDEKGKTKRKHVVRREVRNPYVQSFNPVYIQSGQAPHLVESNPLLRAIEELGNKINTTHIEPTRENPLINTVGNIPNRIPQSHRVDDNLIDFSSITSTPITPITAISSIPSKYSSISHTSPISSSSLSPNSSTPSLSSISHSTSHIPLLSLPPSIVSSRTLEESEKIPQKLKFGYNYAGNGAWNLDNGAIQMTGISPSGRVIPEIHENFSDKSSFKEDNPLLTPFSGRHPLLLHHEQSGGRTVRSQTEDNASVSDSEPLHIGTLDDDEDAEILFARPRPEPQEAVEPEKRKEHPAEKLAKRNVGRPRYTEEQREQAALIKAAKIEAKRVEREQKKEIKRLTREIRNEVEKIDGGRKKGGGGKKGGGKDWDDEN